MEVHRLNLRHLAASAAVEATGSVSGAARIIHLTQPAITQAVAKLERQLGATLFDRRPDGVKATSAGRALAVRVRTALRLIGSRRATSVQIRAFLAIASHGTYASAAQATGLSQASLHRATKDLESAVGPLFERTGRSTLLTRRGRAAVRSLTLATKEIESAIVDVAALAGRETGRIVVGAMPLSRARLLPDAIAAFHEHHPGTDIAVIEGSYAELVGPLRDGRLDLMIGALRDEAPNDLTTVALLTDVPFIVGRADHPLSGTKNCASATSLLAYPWLVPPDGTPLRGLWKRMFETLGASPPHVSIECGSALTIRQLLMGGDHLTLFSPDQIRVELEAGWLALIGPAPGDLSRTIGTTVRADWRATARQSAFLSVIRDCARNIEQTVRKT